MNNIYKNRILKIKEKAKESQILNYFVTKPENKHYISGFSSSNYFILLTEEKDYLLTDFRYLEAAKSLGEIFEIVKIDNIFTTIDFLSSLKIDSIALEYKDITYDFYKEIKSKSNISQLISGDNTIEGIRVIKEPEELEKIAIAAEIANQGFIHILDFIKPGITEKQIALEMEFYLRKNGADALSFDTIIASGINGSMPHAIPSDKMVEKGDLVTMDFGAMYDSYCSDMTRTIGVGQIDNLQRDVYNIVLNAQEKALASVKVGAKSSSIDKIARDIISEAGYAEYFGHGLGHGVGLEIHEAPTLNSGSAEILMANMLVTIEPGIYIPNSFGVRIEDLAIIGESDIIVLSKIDKKLIII
ncbi:MAG: aminopeptidase P family protein [Eubacteriales bacterium]